MEDILDEISGFPVGGLVRVSIKSFVIIIFINKVKIGKMMPK